MNMDTWLQFWEILSWTAYMCCSLNCPALHCSGNVIRINLNEPAKARGAHMQQTYGFRPPALNFRWCLCVLDQVEVKHQTLVSAEGSDDISQMCCDLSVWPAESLPLFLPFLFNYLLFVLLSIPWPCRKPCITNYLHIIRSSLWLLLSIYSGWLSVERFVCVSVCVYVWLRMHVLRVGERVHFDAQFKVGWHYLFMPLLFLFPLRVKNSWRSILGRSRLTQTESIASQLNETHACTQTFRRSTLSIHLPSWLLFVGPSCLKLNRPYWMSSYVL